MTEYTGRRSPRPGAGPRGATARCHLAAHANVPPLDVMFIEQIDRHANPTGVKRLGEVSISDAGAVVTNAAYNTGGVRVRGVALTLAQILGGVPAV